MGNLWTALLLHRVPVLGRLDIGVNSHPVQYRTRRQVDWVTAAYCAARRQAAPLPELMFMYGEDVEWALACSRKGLEVWLEPVAAAIHIGRASVDQSQAPGFAQRKRVEFELAWFGRKGRMPQLAARAILVIHALCRLLIYWPQAVRRGRDDGRVAEYVTLLSHAVGLGRSKR